MRKREGAKEPLEKGEEEEKEKEDEEESGSGETTDDYSAEDESSFLEDVDQW